MNYADLTEKFSGNGALAFSDAAGSKSCLGLAHILLSKHSPASVHLFSNRYHSFYKEWSTPVVLQQHTDVIIPDGIEWLFTGTSHPDSSGGFELKIIRKAQEMGIRTYAFIDHQTALAERFQLGSASVYPDVILLAATVRLSDAIDSGLPKDRLFNIEDPYKTYLRDYWKSELSPEEFRHGYAIPEETTHIVTIAPDPVSLRHDLKAFGFNELTFLEAFLPLIEQDRTRFFILKPHPLQPIPPLKKLLDRYALPHVFLDEKGTLPNPEIMFHSHAIIGFFSNFLVEGNIMGTAIFRYLSPGEDKFDRIFRNFAIQCTSAEQLAQELNAYLGTCKTV